MEFNPDGSLRIPERYSKPARKINIRKDIVSEYTPKKCMMHINGDKSLIQRALEGFNCETPFKVIAADNGFDIEIGSDFKRCSDCRNLAYRLSSFAQGDCNIDNGTCTAKGTQQKFCEEDYFCD